MPSDSRVPKNPKTVSVTAPSGAAYLDELRSLAVDAGLDGLGAAPAVEFTRARAQIDDRISRDLVNGMKFTFLRPERSTHPERLVEGARSVLVGLLSYAHEDPLGIERAEGIGHPDPPRARIARYAWRDHYADLKSSLTQVAARLRLDGHRATVFADDNSIVDREAAWLAGLGWFGKNANLLVPGKGSMFVIGCVVTTAEFPAVTPEADACGSCSRCIPACPTGAIVEPGVIDAHRCLSWLLQKPGVFDRRFREALGDRIYGCDDCQTVCPPTKRSGFAHDGSSIETHVDVLGLLELGDNALDAACDRWYVHDRDMTWVRRNLLVVLGNIGDPRDARVADTVRRYLSHPRPELRAHAVWAAGRLGLGYMVLADDPDPLVVDEMQNLPGLRDDL